ncbi:hypothetical protein AB0M46_47615 [Dactylosporangium sp. NPDC051485]|uniref:hypothetical protein n=1 Tax=Dactylosporangium sp. NPDC051485 TaxID=3154846 RepID=UPI003420A480
MRAEERPIGYWLRELDRRLEAAFASALSSRAVTRRQWQVLNGLGPSDPFWGPGERPYAEVLGELVDRGWALPDGTVTPEGSAARDSIETEVRAIRGRSIAGLSDEEYLTTVRTLAAMVGNLS